MAAAWVRPWRAMSVLGAAAIAVACSSGGGGSVASSSSASSLDSFTQQYCNYLMPCCQAAGLKSDGAQCKLLITYASSQGSYNAQAGSACLSDMQGAQAAGTLCAKPPSCKNVFSQQSTGTKTPGTACTDDDECAPAAEGDVQCRYNYSSGGGESRYCQVQIEGTEGSTPCIGTKQSIAGGTSTSYTTSGSSTEPVPRGYICNLDKGLTCNAETKTCKKLSAEGEPCVSTTECVKTAWCDYASSTNRTCVARLGDGGDCSKGGSSACQESFYCDSTTRKCSAKQADGADCKSSESCTSSRCLNGKCQASSGTSSSSLSVLCGK